ncbi:signal recognition particle, SRP19 subunit [Delitschia confertaspora ATCC 74209]|uniref:Signal recognition particle, SRP19 subunit n=1 Tax=Delitschia confertaspora ATCC 74209 TaxID=1513339 RepID=A0A9P4MW94_9PLEO|nr:signal recognition particle, SRP19 subunit [Delitschia confertaspora ATCC 74209]
MTALSEEVSDSDFDSDPPEDDISSLISPMSIPSSSMAMGPGSSSSAQTFLQPQSPAVRTTTDRSASKQFQCLYPVYFDASRTRTEGRRVGSELAVQNPLAREMADAAASLGLRTVFEPDKTHPKDWSNPGRVRVLLRDFESGQYARKDIKSKHHLYILIAKYLKAHPTTARSPLNLRIAGLPPPKEPLPEPAVPRGWKMNRVLPLHSPALTGGGVSDNFLQDMMAEMAGGAGGEPSSGGAVSKKKDKKKK